MLSHLASDGPEAWTLTTPDRESVLLRMRAAIARQARQKSGITAVKSAWELSLGAQLRRSFLPLYVIFRCGQYTQLVRYLAEKLALQAGTF